MVNGYISIDLTKYDLQNTINPTDANEKATREITKAEFDSIKGKLNEASNMAKPVVIEVSALYDDETKRAEFVSYIVKNDSFTIGYIDVADGVVNTIYGVKDSNKYYLYVKAV